MYASLSWPLNYMQFSFSKLMALNVIFALTRALLYDSGRVKTADGRERAETLSPPPSLLPSCSVSATTEKETRCWNTSLLRDDPLHLSTTQTHTAGCSENSHAFTSDRQQDHSTCSPQLRGTSGGLCSLGSLRSQQKCGDKSIVARVLSIALQKILLSSCLFLLNC